MAVCLIISGGEGSQAVYPLPPDQVVTLGRHHSNHIVLHDPRASRRHAEVYGKNGVWYIRDCETLNGTRVDGQRISEPRPVDEASQIRIGDTLIRLAITETPPPEQPPSTLGLGDDLADAGTAEANPTILDADELTDLCKFMAEAVTDTTPRPLLERALALILLRTQASLAGFLSLDRDQPLPKVVLPLQASVDAQLSRQLTRKVEQEGQLVWVGGTAGEVLQSDSLMSFRDALCVPLKAGNSALGALHVYKNGATFQVREVRFCEVLAGYLASALRALRSRRSLQAENVRLRVRTPIVAEDLVGDSPAMYRVKQDIARLAPRACTVLVQGESGVGKELVATALHRQSPRADEPLVTVNCAAISPNLADSELFGHQAGAFTGADRDHAGYFEQADEGTLFLDEVGELSLDCQAKLLRVLEGKPFRRVGGKHDVYADVRIIAATNRDLEKMVREGKFRQDLYFRLGLNIQVPPLRERPEDVPLLVQHFLPRLSQEYHRRLALTPAAMARLREYSWPGNVRQLRAVLEMAAAMSDDEVLDAADFRLPGENGAADGDVPTSLNMEQVEEWNIRRALKRAAGNFARTAELLGIHRDTLRSKMRKYAITCEEG